MARILNQLVWRPSARQKRPELKLKMPPCGGKGTIVVSWRDVNKWWIRQRKARFRAQPEAEIAPLIWSSSFIAEISQSAASWGKPGNRFVWIPATLVRESASH
jgi:hypothetical protein